MSVVTALRQADIFYDFTLIQLELIASICAEHIYPQSAVIFEQNTNGSELYVIAEGEIDIQVVSSQGGSTTGAPETIARLRRGQSFGEVALLDAGVRSARAVSAQAETHVLVIPRDKLMVLCDSYPQMGYRFMRNLAVDLAAKIRSTDLKVRDYLTWMQNDSR